MGKITGLYRFRMKDKDGNMKLAYCYTETDEFDVVQFNFTEDLEKVRKVFVKYANDNGYKKADLNSIEGTDSFDLNCSSPIDVFNKIERANRGKTILIEWFVGNYAFFLDPFNLHDMDLGAGEKDPKKVRKSKKSSGFDEDEDLELAEENAEDLDDEEDLEEDFDNEDDLDETEVLTEDEFKDKFPTRVRKFFESKLTALKNKWNSLNPKTKVGFIGAGMAALSVAIAIGASVAVNKFGGPTATNSRVASVTDDNDKDKNKDQNDKKDEQVTQVTKDEEKNKEQSEKETEDSKQNTGVSTPSSTDNSYSQGSSNNNYNYSSGSSTNGGSSSSGGTSGGSSVSTGSTTTPGSVNEDVPVFQNPDESLDNSNNGGSSDGETEDSFENVTEEEQDTNIGTGEEEPTQDEDYSEEIDVAPSTEDKDSVDKDDVDFNDELIGNEGAIDDDLSYDASVSLDQSNPEDYEVDYVTPAPLPDPNATAVAGNGDYVTTEEEYNNVKEEEGNTTTPTQESGQTEDYSEEIDVVPVTQEAVPEVQYVDQEAELAARQEANANAVEQAVNEMAEGNDVSLIFNDQTGTVSIEQNTNTDTQTNSMTK